MTARGKVVAWAGVDEICEHPGCNRVCQWRARNKAGDVIAAACNEHKSAIRDALIAKLSPRLQVIARDALKETQ